MPLKITNPVLKQTVFSDIQTKINKLGFIGAKDISSVTKDFTAPIPVKSEYEWQNDFLHLAQDRLLRYNDFEDMDEHPFTSAIFDIYAEEATTKNNAGNIFIIKHSNPEAQKALEELYFKRLNVNFNGFLTSRNLAKYGDCFQFLVLDKQRKNVLFTKQLPPYTMYRLEEKGTTVGFVQFGINNETAILDPFSVVHWRLGLSKESYLPYGVGLLDSARRYFRQLRLMEDAMVVYRIARAPERRIFFINVGKTSTAKAENYIAQVAAKFKKQATVHRDGNNQLDFRSYNMGVDADFFLPVKDGTDGTRIEQLPGAQHLNEIDDVKYFKDQIVTYAKIPRIYLQDPDGGSAERRENLQVQDVRFNHSIARFQSFVLEGYAKIGIVHLLLQGFSKADAINFVLEGVQSSFETEKLFLEIEDTKLNLITTYNEAGFSNAYAYKKLFNMTPKEIKKIKRQAQKEALEDARQEALLEAYKEAYQESMAEKFKEYFDEKGDIKPTITALNKLSQKKITKNPNFVDKNTDTDANKNTDKQANKKEIDQETINSSKKIKVLSEEKLTKIALKLSKTISTSNENDALEISDHSDMLLIVGKYSPSYNVFSNGEISPLESNNYHISKKTSTYISESSEDTNKTILTLRNKQTILLKELIEKKEKTEKEKTEKEKTENINELDRLISDIKT